jgi:hypothetical protein
LDDQPAFGFSYAMTRKETGTAVLAILGIFQTPIRLLSVFPVLQMQTNHSGRLMDKHIVLGSNG